MADDLVDGPVTPVPAEPSEFTLTLIDEETPTIDGRVFEPGKVTWREPPLPLMYLTENVGQGEGHKGAKAGASIQEIWREGSKIVGRGVFGSGPEGQEFQRLVKEGILNGVSADVGGAILEQELAEDGSTQSRIMAGKIMGATVLPFPAFDDMRISVVASAVPTEPPLAWFENPQLPEATPLTITREGQVFGHAALWGTCHVGRPGTCLTPPRSSSNYSYFKTGAVLTADGTSVATGPITLGTGHAGLTLNSTATAEHYDHTGTGIADVTTGEDAHGIWVAGAIRPGIPDEKLHTLRASALSGDWRSVGGKLELIALLAVNTPGFPVPRTRATFADESEALALVAAGIADSETTMATEEMAWSDEARDAANSARSNKGGAARGQERAAQVHGMKEKPDHAHNEPTSKDNTTDETPHNAKADRNEEPIHEGRAAEHRNDVKEYSSEDLEELTDEQVAELTIRVEQLERAIVSLANSRLVEA